MKIYFLIVLFIILLLGMFGMTIPSLLSAANDYAVGLGMFAVFGMGPILYVLGHKICNEVEKKLEGDKKE